MSISLINSRQSFVKLWGVVPFLDISHFFLHFGGLLFFLCLSRLIIISGRIYKLDGNVILSDALTDE